MFGCKDRRGEGHLLQTLFTEEDEQTAAHVSVQCHRMLFHVAGSGLPRPSVGGYLHMWITESRWVFLWLKRRSSECALVCFGAEPYDSV
jgi:hypothetical protein